MMNLFEYATKSSVGIFVCLCRIIGGDQFQNLGVGITMRQEQAIILLYLLELEPIENNKKLT